MRIEDLKKLMLEVKDFEGFHEEDSKNIMTFIETRLVEIIKFDKSNTL